MIGSRSGQATQHKKNKMIKSSKLVLIPALVFALAACNGQKTDIEYLESAKKYAAQGDYKSHVIELKNALQQNPQNADARYLLALAYLSEQQGAAAQKELERAIEYGIDNSQLTDELALAYFYQYKFDDLLLNTIDHQSLAADEQAKVLFYRGLANINLKRSSDAEADLDAATKLGKTPYGQLAQAYLAALNDDFTKAYDLVSELIKKDSQFTEALILAGKIAAANKDLEAAIGYVQQAIALEPNRLQLYVDIANLQSLAKHYDEAEKNVDIVLKSAKSHLPSNLLKASLRMQAKDWEGAKKHAEQALTVSEVNGQAKLLSGMANFYLNNWEISRERLRSVVPLLKPDHIARRMLAYSEFKLGYSQDADDIITSLGDLTERDNQLLSGFGTELARKGKYDEAVTLLERASSLSPDNPETLTRLGILKLQQDDTTGIQDLQHALEQDSNSIWARIALAKQYVKQNEANKALEIANKLIESDTNKPEGYLLAGEIYGATKQFLKAEEILKKGVDKNPKNVAIYFSLYRVAAAQQDYAKASAFNTEILAIEPDNEKSLLNLYRLQKASGNVDNALLQIEKAVKQYSEKDSLKLVYALTLFDNGSDELGVKTLTNITTDSPFYTKAQTALTSFYLRKGTPQDALIPAKNWVKTAPQQEQAHLALTETYLKLKDKKNALITVQSGLTSLPENKPLLLREIQLLLLTEKEEQARAKIARFTASYGKSSELEHIRGNHEASKKNYREALKHYQTLQQLQPSSRTVIGIAELSIKLGEKDAAIQTLKDWLKSHDSDQPVRMYLANITLNTNKKQAIEQYQALVDQNPNNVVALNNLAWALGEQGNLTDAIKHAEKAFNLKPDVAPIIDTYGYLLLLSGSVDEAKEKLSLAHNKMPDEPSIAYHYALALKETGQSDRAKEILKKATTLSFSEKEQALKLFNEL